MVTTISHHEREQVKALTQAFLSRFFENEITSGTDDLKTSFFWLISFLAVPGLFMPMTMALGWQNVARFRGPDVLRALTRGDKAFYVGFAMLAAACVAAIAWNSLMADRRDGLVLGVLPVRPVAIIAARLSALSLYVALVSVGMNVLASLSFGLFLASGSSVVFLVRGAFAHFVASVAASACVFLSITAFQGLVLATVGPRAFARFAPLMQVALVGLIVGGFLVLPAIDVSVANTLSGHGPDVRPWILSTPPLWFLGLYEVLLGTNDPVLRGLAATAATACAAALLTTFLVYPMAYRRVMLTVVQEEAHNPRSEPLRQISRGAIVLLGRASDIRAVGQFLLATMGRVERHRFILAAAVGIVVAWSLPGWISVMSSRPPSPRVELLSLSLAAMVFLVAAFRLAISLPSDVRAGWIFDVSPPSRSHARAAVERAMIASCVVPVALVFAPLYQILWGWHVAIWHTVTSIAMGCFLVELALLRFYSLPCVNTWDPQGGSVARHWGAYLIGFGLFTAGVSSFEIGVFGHTVQLAGVVAAALVATLVLRIKSLRKRIIVIDDSAFAPGDVLSLN